MAFDYELFSKIITMILLPFIFVMVIMPFIKNMAVRINAIDIPRTRHIHTEPTPKLGGLAMFFAFLLGYMVFGTPSSIMNAVLIGSFIVIIVGVIDDITELGPFTKLVGQLAAAFVIVFYGKLLITDITAFGLYINFSFLSYPLTILFIIGCINCINLIDGLDGLSGGISSIYFLTIGIIATAQGKLGLDFVLAFVMFGSTLGFLMYNFHPASIFAGDSGSMFMGFIISIIALLGFKNVTMTSLIIPLVIIAIPILDTLFAIVRRLLKKENPAKGDRLHIHHQLLDRNLSQRKTVGVILFIDALFAFATIVYYLYDVKLGYIIYGILLLIVIIFVMKTNVVFDHEEIRKRVKKMSK